MSQQKHQIGQSVRTLGWFAVILFTLTGSALAESWTDLRGTRTIQARMIGLWDDNVILELTDGRRVSVKLEQLRSESRIQAQELAKGLEGARGERVKNLQGQAAAAAAPAPDPLPQPPAAPAYTPPSANVGVAEFLNQLDTAVWNGHIAAIYDALPPSYRQDVNDIVKLGAQNIQPATWQSLVGTTQRLGDLIVTRQRWVLSSPRIQSLPPDQLVKMETQMIAFGGVLRAGLDPESMQLQKLQTMDFGQWLAECDKAVAPHLAQLFQTLGGSGRQVTVSSEKGDTATVEIEMDGAKNKVTYTKVEGYWVPKTLADDWAQLVTSRKQAIEGSSGSLLQTYASWVQPIAPMLETLAAAKDSTQFHGAMESIFVPAEALAGSFATEFGDQISLAVNRSGSSGGGGGFGGMEGYNDDGMGGEDEYPDDYDPFSEAMSGYSDE